MLDETKGDEESQGVRLESWKEIANYVNKKTKNSESIRTLLRWRKQGLPVLKCGYSVYAYTDQIDAWLEQKNREPVGTVEQFDPIPEPNAANTLAPTLPEAADPINRSRKPFSSQFRRLTAGVLTIMMLACGLFAWRSWPLEVQLFSYRQLTRDGRTKISGPYSDGVQVFFGEDMDGKPVVAAVPLAGGKVNHLVLPVTTPALLGISSIRKSLIIYDMDSGRLYEFGIDSHDLREIPIPADGFPGQARWDSEGRRIAVLGKGILSVFAPWTASQARYWAIPEPAHLIGWGPHSRLRVNVVQAKTDTTEALEVIESRAQPLQVTHVSLNSRERAGDWSGDNRFFAFEAGPESHTQIWIADIRHDPTSSYQLTLDNRIWAGPAFVPGSTTIVASAHESQGRLTILGEGQRPGRGSILAGGSVYELDYSRDGQWVAYTTFPEQTLWRSRADGSDARQLTPGSLIAHQPHWSPDGTRIAFMGATTSGRPQSRIYLVSSAGGALDQPFPAGDDQGIPTWLPDGGSLVFGDLRVPVGFEGAQIHELNLRTQLVKTIPTPIGMWSPRMSPDGRFLAAISHDNKSIYLRDNETQAWKKCSTMDLVEEPVWASDSAWIQFVVRYKSGRYTVFRMDAPCTDSRQVLDLTPYPLVGAMWVGINPQGDAPIGLVGLPDEVYALDWNLRRTFPTSK